MQPFTRIEHGGRGLHYRGDLDSANFPDGWGVVYHLEKPKVEGHPMKETMVLTGSFKDGKADGKNMEEFRLDKSLLFRGSYLEGNRERGVVFDMTEKWPVHIGRAQPGAGPNTYFMANGYKGQRQNTYKGQFVRDFIKSGFGIEYWANGQIFYAGNFVKNAPDGDVVTLFGDNGEVEFRGMVRNGICTLGKEKLKYFF